MNGLQKFDDAIGVKYSLLQRTLVMTTLFVKDFAVKSNTLSYRNLISTNNGYFCTVLL